MKGMTGKAVKRWRKALLFVGLVLTALAVVEIGTAAFGAQERIAGDRPDSLQQQPVHQQLLGIDLPTPPEEAIISNAPLTDSLTTPAVAATDNPAEASTHLAMKSTPSNSAAVRSTVSTMSSESLAIAAWAGASFPVENFQAYTSPFGYRQAPDGSYRREFHYGLDIAAPQGSYIRSWWSGRVVEVTDNTNCGTSIIIQSGSWVHIYCHMQGRTETNGGRRYLIDRTAGLQIWEGQEIVAGDRIGRVGMTGRTTGPHLHWGLKYEGNWVDPAWVIRAMAVSQQATVR